jgi:hypothetical protein
MTEQDEKVMALLGMPKAMEEAILPLIVTVKNFMLNAGISKDTVDSDKANGLISIGVKDLYSFNGGSIAFSPVFHLLLSQLAVAEEQADE